jgi:hypothetical protein
LLPSEYHGVKQMSKVEVGTFGRLDFDSVVHAPPLVDASRLATHEEPETLFLRGASWCDEVRASEGEIGS